MRVADERDEAIVVCCVGDGATEEGVFWESLNFAALAHLPICFICENNRYSVHAHIGDRQAGVLTDKVIAFGARAYTDVACAIHGAREGNPTFVEVHCTRMCNHVGNMPDFRTGQ